MNRPHDIRECAGRDLGIAIVQIEFNLHRSRVLADILRDARDRSVVCASRICRYAESDLLAFLNSGCVCFRYRNDHTQAAQAFNSHDWRCSTLARCGTDKSAWMQVPLDHNAVKWGAN